MKKILLFIPTLLLFTVTFGQQNGDFENWSTDTVFETPNDWISGVSQVGSNDNVAKSNDGHNGNHSIRLINKIINGDSVFGFIANGDIGDNFDGGQAFSNNADTLRGWYKCLMQPGDSAIILVNFQNPTDTSMIIHIFAGDTVNTWTEFALPINPLAITPDTVLFALASSDAVNEKGYQEGSWIMIDDLKFYKNGQPVSSDLPNPGFENWSYVLTEDPDNWSTYNFAELGFGGIPVVKSTNSSNGTYAAQLNTLGTPDDTLPGILSNGDLSAFGGINGGQPYAGLPDSLIGDYIYNAAGLDTAWINMEFRNNGNTVGGNGMVFINSGTSYSSFRMNANLLSISDTVLITIFSGKNPGSQLMIDNLQFMTGPVGVEYVFNLKQLEIYPNPAIESFQIGSLDLNENVKRLDVLIFSTEGKLVQANLNISRTDLNEPIRINNLSGGVYLVQVKSNSQILASSKLILE